MPLVTQERSFQLTTQIVAGGIHKVFSGTVDITGQIPAGKLGGLLNVRAHNAGTARQSRPAGRRSGHDPEHRSPHRFRPQRRPRYRPLVPPAAGGVGAAAALSVSITDPALFAASSDGTPGSNGNLAVISAVHDQAVAAGQKPLDFYSRLIFRSVATPLIPLRTSRPRS